MVQYGTGAAQGTLVTDDVSFAGFTVNNQTFAAVNQAQGVLRSSQPVAGILGLAFQAIANSRAPPIWQALAEAGRLPENVMAFALRRWTDKQTTAG
jgi:cathepsin D